MGYAGMLGLMATSGVSALSSINEGVQAKKFSKYQAKQSKADANAALGAAKVEANKIRSAASAAESQAVAATANSGVVVGDGSASLIEQSIRQRGEEDALMTIYDGQDARRRGYVQAKAYRIQGENAFNQGLRNSFGSLIMAGGAGVGVFAKWLKDNEDNTEGGTGGANGKGKTGTATTAGGSGTAAGSSAGAAGASSGGGK